MSEENEILIISDEETNERLDKILAKHYSEIGSRTYFQYLIEKNLVLLNGEPVKKRIKPKAGDEIEIEFALTPEIALTAENIPLDILYEDDDILIINKPVGMVVHPAPGNWTGTFVNALLYHCKHLPESDESLRPGIVHRLDKDTSGVLVAAKTITAQQKLIELFSERHMHKEYLAICIGNPGNAKIDAPIARHPVHRKLMAINEAGKPSQTTCKTLAFDGKLSLVKLILHTGRTHQIRVHMKHRGTPVLGDSLYGNSQQNKKHASERQMLHASVLRFNHPITEKKIEIIAPVPKDMQDLITKIKSGTKI